MSPSFCRRTPSIFLVVVILLLPSVARDAGARIRETGKTPSTMVAPAPVLPPAGARVDEGAARFEVSSGAGVTDLRIVVARFPFEPSGWSSAPSGPAWAVVPYGTQPIPLESLGLVDRTDTKLWWAVVWKDMNTGAMRASEVRELTVVPRFANRVGADGALRPSATGRLPQRLATTAGENRRPIELASGYTLVPGGPPPVIPAQLKRAEAATGGDARRAYLVQFADDSPDAARERIVDAGGEVVSPMSGGGFLVRMRADASERLQKASADPWIAPYEPAYKLSPLLDLSASGRIDVTALLFMDGGGDATVAALGALGATNLAPHRGSLNHLVRFELDPSRLADAAALADVQWIEPTPEYSFNNDKAQWVVQSGVENSRPLTERGIRGQGQVVTITDSGLRTNHEMFNDSTQAIEGWGDYPNHRKIIAYRPGSDSPLITFGDDVHFDYHGTHTSGTVAGNPDPTSAAPWSGVAKDARLYFMDVAGTDGVSLRIPPDLNDLFQPSYTGNTGGASRISSNSWGNSSALGRYTLPSMQADQFVWNHPDYLLAIASGNVGVFASVGAPATAKNCLTVGATGNGTNQNQLASFSSRGPTRDGRRKPTVMAPGHLVTSAYASTRYTYASYSGTSMATPAVAGAMALVREYLMEGWYPTGAPIAANAFVPSAALLRAMAVNSARNDVVGFRVPDNTIGYGRLTIDDALYFPGDSSRTLLVDTRDGLSNQEFAEYQLYVTDPTRPLKIALCWTDYPGNPASAVQIVNDLDLIVTHDTTTYRGNYLLNYVSAPNGTRDSLNVEELVRVPTPGVGLWTIRVEGRRVVQAPQAFALCITGGVGGPDAGAVALDRFQYGLSDSVEIEVIDTDASGPITAQVWSNTEPSPQNVALIGVNGMFHGSFAIAPALAQQGDGVIAVSSGDMVTVSYEGGGGSPVVATARVNVEAPTITNVNVIALGTTQAVVSWTTHLNASSRVRFGSTVPLETVVDSSGYTMQHSVLLSGLQPGTTYRYDVESVTPLGAASVDSLDGQHRSFTTHRAGTIALLMDDPNPAVLVTWSNAFAALGWDVDILPAASNDPPLVGHSSAGLRSYQAVLWQVDPNKYPPFSDAQRAAIDSLLDFGGRLLVTGHDIGFGLCDAGSPSYTPEREAWLESGLKTRYYIDNLYADSLTGVSGSPVSGAYTNPIRHFWNFGLYPDPGDNVGPAPATDGIWAGDWTENFYNKRHIGMHWESNSARGTSGVGVWGGQQSRLVGLFYEWRAFASTSTSHVEARTGVLRDAVSWLLGHSPPEAHILEPAPGAVVTDSVLHIRYSVLPDTGRAITTRWMDYSLDGGDSWTVATTAVCADSGCTWDLTGALGGAAIPNSADVLLRLRVTDDGSPALQSTAVMSGSFALARNGGDTRGPVLVAGSASCSPLPIRSLQTAMVMATFTDEQMGAGTIAAAEFSTGPTPAPAGTGIPMSGAFGAATVQAAAELAVDSVMAGTMTFWLRGRDGDGNWGAATALLVPTAGPTPPEEEVPAPVDFLAAPTPNPSRELSTIRFGLAQASEVNLELYDLAGRRVQTLISAVLPPGSHAATWNGRDRHGNHAKVGVYFVRLTTPSKVFHTRLVRLQ